MNGWLYTTLPSYVSQQKSKCGACSSPTTGTCSEFHHIDRLPSTLLRYSTRFSTAVFENLSLVYRNVLVVRINKKSNHILIAILQSCYITKSMYFLKILFSCTFDKNFKTQKYENPSNVRNSYFHEKKSIHLVALGVV